MIPVLVQFLLHRHKKGPLDPCDAADRKHKPSDHDHLHRRDVVGFVVFLLFVMVVTLMVAYGRNP